MGSRGKVRDVCAGQEVTCTVLQALDDLIMVSFSGPGNKVFQGVLLEASKRNVPYGICPPGGFTAKVTEDFQKTEVEVASTEYPTLSRRQTYYQEGRPPAQPLSVPGGRGGKTFLSQDKLGVKLRARTVLCSKCSGVCNEKGENVREISRKEKETRGKDREDEKRTSKIEEKVVQRPGYIPAKVATVSSSTSDMKRPGRPAGSVNKTKTQSKIILIKAKKEPSSPLKPSIENSPTPIVDLDKFQARATSNCLVPKLRRLRIPGMIQQHKEEKNPPKHPVSESTPESVPTPCSSTQEPSDSTITSSGVSSSTSSVPPDSMQPLRIRFAHKLSSRNSSRQYSIVKDEDSDSSDQQKENIDDNDSEDSEVEKRKNVENLESEAETQPLKKVFKKDSVSDVVGACRVTHVGRPVNTVAPHSPQAPQAAPVLKISFGKEPTVSTLPIHEPSTEAMKDEESLKHPSSLPSPNPNHSASSKAARKALKRAKKEAQRRARLGLASPARTYLGSRSPGNLANYSPTCSPLHLTSPRPVTTPSPAYTLLCPTSQKIIIKKVKKKKHKRGRQLSEPEAVSETSSSAKLFPPTKDEEGVMRRSLRECRPLGLPPIPLDESCDFLTPLPSLPVESAVLPDGHTLCVGDVVWGRAEVNGWWPGKVVNLMMKEEGKAFAQVTWYTCTTTSILPCKELKPFLESYETQFNKRKAGSYPEAVNLATEDARQASSLPLAGSPHQSPLSSPQPFPVV